MVSVLIDSAACLFNSVDWMSLLSGSADAVQLLAAPAADRVSEGELSSVMTLMMTATTTKATMTYVT